jgi:hypothetical protein
MPELFFWREITRGFKNQSHKLPHAGLNNKQICEFFLHYLAEN